MLMNEIKWWWLSYADEEKGFLGAAIIAADDFVSACQISAFLKISPGGQVAGAIVNNHGKDIILLSQTFRLLNKIETLTLSEKIDSIKSDYCQNQA